MIARPLLAKDILKRSVCIGGVASEGKLLAMVPIIARFPDVGHLKECARS
jgi:hypothetical protein